MLPTWNDTGIAFANHIWQSTLFMILVGLLALLFRRNGAVIRYRLWLIASVKFLVPFSLFVGLGGLLQWHPVRTVTPSEVPVVVRQISQPFTSAPIKLPSPSIAKAAPAASPSITIAFAFVWFGGAAIVLLVWLVRWMQLVRIVRRAEPLDASNSWVPSHSESPRVRILSSPAAIEPGVFGIVRPTLLIPENIARDLSNAQLQAVIAHEMFHVRGRDNLAAAMHTVVQALFWFHPLVWWLGNRLVAERERACDEAVLQSGHDPAEYAEGILKVCKSNLMMPACVAGVSGSNLKKRIEVIMENRGTRGLTPGKKLLLAVAGTGVLIAPVFAGMMSAAESPIGAVPEIQLPVVERATSAVLSEMTSSSTPQAAPVAIVQLETKTGTVRAGVSAMGGSFMGLNYSTNNFLGYGETISADIQAGTRQSNFVLSMTEPYFQDRPVALLQVSPSAPQSTAQPTGQAVAVPRNWLDDVSIIITDQERIAFQRLTKDSERQGFITNFWLARDPTPGTPANEFKEEYDKRFAYANEHFTTQSGIPGSKTDRGKMYMLNGPPNEIVSHPSGGTYYRPADQRVLVTNTFPFETWRYQNMNGKGDNLVYEFVDKLMNGNYTLNYSPSANVK